MSHALENERGSVSVLISCLRTRGERATGQIWTRYLRRVRTLAARLLFRDTRRAYDENDAAQSVLSCVFEAFADGKYPEIDNRETLWALIATITQRKVAQRNRFETQLCRDQRRSVPLDERSAEHAPMAVRPPLPGG